MATKNGVSDERLASALGGYAGMVHHVIADPERWLGVADPTPATGLARRAFEGVRDRALGTVTPSSPGWDQRPLQQRVDWWVRRIGVSAGLAAAAPRFAGALADRVPLQAALGANAAGLTVCAVAREHGVTAAADWVPLLAKVVFDRDLTQPAPVPPAEDSERDLASAAEDPREPPSALASLGQGVQGSVRAVWRLARALLEVQALLDERPRGGLLARTVAKLPVVGVAGGWLDERGGIRRAAQATTKLVSR